MDRKTFYERLIAALLQSGYHLDAKTFSRHHVEHEGKVPTSSVRTGLKIAGVVAGMFIDLPDGIFDLEPEFDKESFRQDIEKIHPLTTLVLFKFILAQPMLLAVVEADSLTHREYAMLTDKFDSILPEFRKHTASMGVGFKSGPWLFRKTKLNVAGILMFIFFDSSKAKAFISLEQKNCKRSHPFKGTNLSAWVVDVSAGLVDSGARPFLGFLGRNKLQEQIFGGTS